MLPSYHAKNILLLTQRLLFFDVIPIHVVGNFKKLTPMHKL